MNTTLGILALLEARPGRSEALAAFLEQGRELALAEEATVTWYAFKVDETTYGIFDSFASEAGRRAHLEGEIPRALAQIGGELLAKEPEIRLVELVAVK
ncbi:MAG TPA: antibiotic biosynthesis monooxygenase [Solirubrobacteraceae bacterium]|jgi:quinol monooxygenase YgiN|nr:antibiotic biosynthesis monooxygenase [Solirubrobacteraceae bacterium]